MRLRLAELFDEFRDGIRRFNQRLREGGIQEDFLLPEPPREPSAPAVHPAVRKRHWLLLEEEIVRGGCILQEHELWLGQEVRPGANLQMPITEGVVDRRFAHLGAALLKIVLKEYPYLYAVGMGGLEQPLPRLLQALRFRVVPSAFLFRVLDARRCLREIRAWRAGPLRRRLAEAAALSGLGLRLLQARAAWRRPPRLEPEALASWPAWADELWSRARQGCSFAVVRDRAMLGGYLHPEADRLCAVGLWRSGQPAGWAALLNSELRDHPHFGNLRLTTVLDALALPGLEPAVAAAAARAAAERGAELIIANHSHAGWIRAFRASGFLPGPSNYLIATSPALTAAALADDPTGARFHVTRADGDGRIHL